MSASSLFRSVRHLAIIAVLGLMGSAAWWWSQGRSATPQVDVVLLDGQRLNTAQYRGQVLLVNFWATSCTVCVAEMPQIVALHDKFKSRGYQTLAVAMQYDPPTHVSDFAQDRRLPFGVAIDNTGLVARSFGDVAATPTTFLINRRGQIVQRYLGAPDFVVLDALIARLLADT